MSHHFLRELSNLNQDLLGLGGLVEEQVRHALKAVNDNDIELAQTVIDTDSKIDDLEVQIEEECLKILALHQPVARDLRYIVAVLKINNDLERIGDLAVNISKRARLFDKEPGFEIPDTFERMAELTLRLLKKILDALVRYDLNAAKEVCVEDDPIDELNAEIYQHVKHTINTETPYRKSLIHLLTVSRHLERIGDHVTNIAEDIVYMMEGTIVRHGGVDAPE